MRRRTEKGVGNQVGLSLVEQVGQRLLPLVAGIGATKQGLLEWVHDFGLKALDELMRDDAARIVGEKGKHRTDRTHHYWGRTRSELTFGGRRISVEKPRVRSKEGREEAPVGARWELTRHSCPFTKRPARTPKVYAPRP